MAASRLKMGLQNRLDCNQTSRQQKRHGVSLRRMDVDENVL